MSTRRIVSRIHAVAAVLATATILSFLSSSVVAELWGDPALVATVKQAIAWALLLLVPSLIATGASGYAMVGRPPKGLAATKLKRMRLIAANGILVLAPSALFLAWKAGAGEFDAAFVAVQAIEFAAGSANLVLMGLNMRDGLRLSGRLRRVEARTTPATR